MQHSRFLSLLPLALALFVGLACGSSGSAAGDSVVAPPPVPQEGMATAVFAGGCFWCMEPPFDELDGVVATISGYTAGEIENPTYQQVSAGRTRHTEAVQIHYDPEKISYEELLAVYWPNVDPLTADRQFCDRGSQYRPGIYFANDEEKQLAEASKRRWEESGSFDRPIVVEIEPATAFWPAEDYHQDFYKKNPDHYYRYRRGCGRDARLKELWGELAGK